MSLISLKWFGGLVPRKGEQHLPAPHATEAENVDLFSGELRPMKRPALAHQFCRPEDECWNEPLPDDPSYPPQLPPGPGEPGYPGGPGPCVAPIIVSGPDDALATIGMTAGFAVTINEDAVQPVLYQWYEDNVLIPGATSSTLAVEVTNENFESTFSVSVTNTCGTALGEAKIIIDVPEECEPYRCDSLQEAMLAGMTPEGSGMWPLLEPNDKVTFPTIPAVVTPAHQFMTGTQGAHDLVPINSVGDNWNNSVFFAERELDDLTEDLNLCEGPYVWKNTHNSQTGSQASFRLSPNPPWNGIIPNCSIAVVIRGADVGSIPAGDSDNYLFRGTTDFHSWGQLSIDNSAIENSIRVMRREVAGEDVDSVGFNWGRSNSDWYFNVPKGVLRGDTESVLIQASIAHGSIRFTPTSYQGYYYASYDMMAFIYFACKITTASGAIYSGSNSFEYKIAQVFDWSHGDGRNRPFNTNYWPYDTGEQNTKYFMQGGWKAIYNLALHVATGSGGPGSLIMGGGPQGIDSSLSLRFLQNRDDYDPPPECGIILP